MVQVLSSRALAASVVVAATLASCATIPITRHFNGRDVAYEYNELSARNLLDLIPRSEVEEIFERSYDELVELEAREMLEDLYIRSPNGFVNFFKKIGKGIKKAAGKVFGVVKGVAGAVLGRDLDEADLAERDAGYLASVINQMYERDFNEAGELNERELGLQEIYSREFDVSSVIDELATRYYNWEAGNEDREFINDDSEIYERGWEKFQDRDTGYDLD